MSGGYGHWRRRREGLLSSISIGVFLVLVGIIFVTTPGLFDKIIAFFQDFDLIGIPSSSGLNILLPAPKDPAAHLTVYRVVQQFSIAWGIFQIMMLVIRFVYQSPVSKKSETISNIIFWLGTAYAIQIMLIMPPVTDVRWFSFWAMVLIVLGISLLVRAMYLAAMWPLSRRHLYPAPSTTA